MSGLEPGVQLSPDAIAAMERLRTPSPPRNTMSEQHEATPEQWAIIRQIAQPREVASGILAGDTTMTLAAGLMDLFARVEALEADQLEQAESSRFCIDAIVRRVEALGGGCMVARVTPTAEALKAVQQRPPRQDKLGQRIALGAVTEVAPIVAPSFDSSLVERNPECLASWPDCYEGGYDPRCCRFPKSCSCEVRQEAPANSSGSLTSPPTGSLVQRVATDAELCQAYNDAPSHGFGPALRAVYDLGRQHGAAPIRSGPESPLVERVADAIAAQATSAGIVNDRPARAAISEVAAALIDWWDSDEVARTGWEAAKWLEREANR